MANDEGLVASNEWFIENANIEDVEDCLACSECGDICPVHYGMQCGINKLGFAISRVATEPELLDHIPADELFRDEETNYDDRVLDHE